MDLDTRTCEAARLSRDARFDGRFFIGVVTTGIYCRPVCPAPSPRERNVRYFLSAAAAAEAGFRPCLRCRPETSPGTPAWLGTSATVSRALRLIEEGSLDEDSVDGLASRLGLGSRHLRRLFLEHLGATPIAVAQTRRIHFAKTLIDETALPFTQVALASGFRSIRRFNDCFRKLYGRSPTGIRGLARRAPVNAPGQYRFLLRFRPPFDWQGLTDFLAHRAIPGVETVSGNVYRRTIALNGHHGWIEASLDLPGTAVVLRISFPEVRSLFTIIERVRRIFDLRADPSAIAASLGGDPLLRPLIRKRPGVRVPGAWDGFEIAVRAILGQQVSVKGASTLAGRLVEAFGEPIDAAPGLTHLFPSPEALAVADVAGIGLPAARAEAIRQLARAAGEGRIRFSDGALPEHFREVLCSLPGIGPWTAQYVSMRALGDPDAFPASDLGLLRAAVLANPKQLEERSGPWRPWRAYAAMLLWQAGTQLKGKTNHADPVVYVHEQPRRAIAAGGR